MYGEEDEITGNTIKERPLFWHYPHCGNQGGEPSSIIMEGDWKLIYCHENEHHELYNITEDIGEQKDLASIQPKRTKAMKARLKQWLDSTGAKFPTKDTQFDPAKREARWHNLRTAGKNRLEKQHAGFLNEDFKPNQDWGG